MQVAILADGLGTGFRPSIESIPKSMIRINNKPFLEYLICGCLKEKIANEGDFPR